jgi:hypothetical protein
MNKIQEAQAREIVRLSDKMQKIKMRLEWALSVMPDQEHEDDTSATMCDLYARSLIEDCVSTIAGETHPASGKDGEDAL